MEKGRDGMKEYFLSETYLTPLRWMSYYKQIELIRSTGARSILEIGPGPGIVSGLFKSLGVKVDTLDIDEKMEPTWLGDVIEVLPRIPAGSYECVLAAQVLEHIHWEDFITVMGEIARVTSRWCVISLPYAGITLIPSIRWGRYRFHDWHIGGRIPAFWRAPAIFNNAKEVNDHKWEVGIQKFGNRRIIDQMQNDFKLIKQDYHPMNHAQTYYLLESNKANEGDSGTWGK